MTQAQGSGRCRDLQLMTRWQAIENYLWPKGPSRDVWMIVDCARDPKRIFRFLLASHLEQSCLYSGPLAPAMEMAAPYLLQLEHDSEETRRLIELSWGNSWGVFLRSPTNLVNLRKHLRSFLIVKDPEGRRMTFRYYDPRILRVYLPTCTGGELRTVFGPIEFFWTEDWTEEDHMLEFEYQAGRLIRSTRSLKHFEAADPQTVTAT
jgi:hypothetical protein